MIYNRKRLGRTMVCGLFLSTMLNTHTPTSTHTHVHDTMQEILLNTDLSPMYNMICKRHFLPGRHHKHRHIKRSTSKSSGLRSECPPGRMATPSPPLTVLAGLRSRVHAGAPYLGPTEDKCVLGGHLWPPASVTLTF